ncbi:Calx-beta domain-containing protein, partial [Crocosphaera sp. Alani8]|uniref:Calx-beta domain-containing protein n=1 Tax=Crocosphaera sp. Alani8 TaxID=3038952 RepID=UPI00313F24CF
MNFLSPEVESLTPSSSLISPLNFSESGLETSSPPNDALGNSSGFDEGLIETFALESVNSNPDQMITADTSMIDPLTGSEGINSELFTFALIDAVTDQVVSDFDNLAVNNTINLSQVDLTEFNISAVVNPDHSDSDAVARIKFVSNLGNRTEGVAPYALFGDNGNGDYYGKLITEGTYSITATAYDSSGAILETQTVDYMVTNPTPPSTPEISIGNVSVNENDNDATFTVTLSEPSSQTISVDYATVDDTAIAGSDYTATNGTLTFGPNETSKTFSVAL